jgi:fatty acyl-ACP thioesterase A
LPHTRRCLNTQTFPVRCYEVGPDQLATMVTVANLLQECAANHAQALWGDGRWAPALMTEQHLAFALSKLHIRLDAPLRWGASVRVATWFAEAGTLAARRDWTITDAATGARVGAATSTWLAFNLNTRRMARLPPELRTYFQTASPQPPRWSLGATWAAEKCVEIPAQAPCLVSSTSRVRRCDLDMNRHVNNASYLEWVMDDVPAPVFEAAFMSGVDIEYRSECKYGDEIASRSSLLLPDGTCLLPGAAQLSGEGGGEGAVGGLVTFQHALVRPSDGAELLRARTTWRHRDDALAAAAAAAAAGSAVGR